MQSKSTSGSGKSIGLGTTRISERATWNQLQQCAREENGDFSRLLARNFLLLLQQAKNKKDATSIQTLEVIISGLVDLTKAIESRKSAGQSPPGFSATPFTIFSRLAESYNNPSLLKQVGLHYMVEWGLPDTALRHFQRALSLGGPERALRSLIEMTSITIQRHHTATEKIPATMGVTTSFAANPNVTRIIRETDKQLITKTQRPSPQAKVVMARSLKAQTTVALPDAIKDCLKEAARQLTNGNLAGVYELLLKAAKYPVKKTILCAMWSNLGRAHYQAGNYLEMEEAYLQAYVHGPKESNNYFNLALAKSMNRKMAEAETLYRFAAKLDPSNPKVWCNLGILYFQNDRFKDAERAYRSAIQSRPEYARAWENLASALLAQDKVDEAIEACRKAIQLRPGYPEAYFKLSAIYFGKGDPASLQEAARTLSYVFNYAPLAASANAMLSMIHSRLQQVDSAKASLQRAVESDPKCVLLPTVWNELETAIRSSSTIPKG
ncbi:MAG: tetratricopeptide repeat protein [Methylacidiphilales bacterium]|nr:tetratricopeptide repeat protein [Candidatus Methylacidiphilales bacterium]